MSLLTQLPQRICPHWYVLLGRGPDARHPIQQVSQRPEIVGRHQQLVSLALVGHSQNQLAVSYVAEGVSATVTYQRQPLRA